MRTLVLELSHRAFELSSNQLGFYRDCLRTHKPAPNGRQPRFTEVKLGQPVPADNSPQSKSDTRSPAAALTTGRPTVHLTPTHI